MLGKGVFPEIINFYSDNFKIPKPSQSKSLILDKVLETELKNPSKNMFFRKLHFSIIIIIHIPIIIYNYI